MSLTSTLTTLSEVLEHYIIQSTYSYHSNTRKDLECEYLTRASRSNTGTVQQLKESVSDTLREENDTVIEAKNLRLSVLRSSKKEKEKKSGPLWYRFNETKILDPRIHDGEDGVFVSVKKGDKSVKRIVSLQVEKETRDAKIEEVKEEEEEEEEEEEDTKQDDTMFGLDDVREAELRKHPKYRPQKCATVMGLKWDVRDSSFLANNQDMTRRRVGILYGNIINGWVHVRACYEPPQRGFEKHVLMFDMSSSERDSVRSVAKSLGLRPVGMVMLHFGRGSRDEKSTWCSSARVGLWRSLEKAKSFD